MLSSMAEEQNAIISEKVGAPFNWTGSYIDTITKSLISDNATCIGILSV